MRTHAIYKRSYNRLLSVMIASAPGSRLPGESRLARDLGVSRTTVRGVLAAMTRSGLLTCGTRRPAILRRPEPADFFPEIETKSVREIVEQRFMDMIQQRDIRPGQQINTLELARQFGVSPAAVREFLGDFSQCGLLERRPESSWVFLGFDAEFARELFEVRELFELAAAARFADLAADDPVWPRLAEIEARHRDLLGRFDSDWSEFPRLDDALHKLIGSVAHNRFIDRFNALRSLIFHYHYQWRKDDEKPRNLVALNEHLAYIAALQSRDRHRIRAAAIAHLHSAGSTLLASIAPRKP